jgi:hypothetical protein
MNRQEALDMMYASIVEDMTFMYTNAGLSQEEVKTHLDQNVMAFQLICSNMYEKLLSEGALNA